MATTAKRSISVALSGDATLARNPAAADNPASFGKRDIVRLAAGNNTINAPAAVTGFTLAGVTVIPPSGNAQTITLKGVGGDTGIALHKTDPSSIALDAAVASFVLNAGAQIDGVELIWS